MAELFMNKRARRDTSDDCESSSFITEEQLQCSVCDEVFTDPVTTPCGHNFCTNCITQSWEKKHSHYCPLCNEKFTERPELKLNTTLREAACNFMKKNATEQKMILCHDCSGVKQKASFSCVDCGVSLCTSHLELHNRILRDKKHSLINPVENVEDYRCKTHGKPLSLFCKDDQMCLCQFCTEIHHRNHVIIPLEDESRGRKRQKKKETSESVEVFTALIHSIKKSQAELQKVMEKKQKAVKKQAGGLVKELEEEIDKLKRRDAKIEQLSHSDDHLHLIQIYPTVCRFPSTKNWTNIRIDSDLSVKALMTNLSELQETLNKKLSEKQKNIVDVTLDPETANPHLILDLGGKQVTHGDKKQDVPDTPKRFTHYTAVLGTQGFSSGRFYYEVQVSGKTEWRLGVARESVNRKEKLEKFCPQNGFWTVILRNEDEYTARDNTYIPLSLREKPQKVGVFVDYEEGLVSFYDVEATSHIYSFTGQSFTEKIYPYLSPCPNDGGKNSAPLIITCSSKFIPLALFR
ncbi:bloodthirsty-relatedprotein family, member 6 [Silurus asotus]|uniref:Bloodthirsty-relatedprotein family, member 6 n=1 Tax=Silurus asotus TaxID=30991 RepID=A0AAD5A826_SILAS|nr:bloodthirsty-relatedprotein family, member 6 [Silurus asotus]